MKGLAKRTALMIALSVAVGSESIARCGPIHDATAKGNEAKVISLLKANPDLVNSRDKFGNTPLHFAAKHNRVEIAELLLRPLV